MKIDRTQNGPIVLYLKDLCMLLRLLAIANKWMSNFCQWLGRERNNFSRYHASLRSLHHILVSFRLDAHLWLANLSPCSNVHKCNCQRISWAISSWQMQSFLPCQGGLRGMTVQSQRASQTAYFSQQGGSMCGFPETLPPQ